MSYVYADAEALKKKDAVGNKQCVALVKLYARTPPSSLWRQGVSVKDSLTLAKGTAIATFENGRYQNRPTGNHAALYISQDAAGILVVDQWSRSSEIHLRRLPFLGKDKQGNFINPSSNGDAFSVIE